VIPVSVVTGFLGSGKTTLIGRILRTPGYARTAVIVNEFGEIGLDHDLIASSDETLLALTTGCLCCAVRGDLVETLIDLRLRRDAGEIAFDREIHAVVFGFGLGPAVAIAVAAVVAGTGFFLTQTGIGDHAEVMVGELQVVFGLDAIPVEVGVLCHLAVFFKQLRRIPACTAIDTVELLTAALRTVVTAAAPAVVPTIVVQLKHVLVWGGVWHGCRYLLPVSLMILSPRNSPPRTRNVRAHGSQHLLNSSLG
jgi:hypothetical protein